MGVGQIALHPGCFIIEGLVWLAVTVGVAKTKDEPPLSDVRTADFLRRVESCRRSVTHAFQVSKDMLENRVMPG